jgi:hypothetical protein
MSANNGFELKSVGTGWAQVPHSLIRHPELSPLAKLTWIALKSYAGRDGTCFPGHVKLATDTGISKRKIILCIQELEEVGVLEVERRPNRPNIYRLIGVGVVHSRGALGASQMPDGVQEVHGGVHGVQPRGASCAPELDLINNTQEQEARAQAGKTKNGPVMSQEEFEQVWTVFPKKECKADACDEWRSARLPLSLLPSILAAIGAWSKTDRWREENGRYVPHLAKWIKGKRWTDSLQENVPKRSVGDWRNDQDNITARRLGDSTQCQPCINN